MHYFACISLIKLFRLSRAKGSTEIKAANNLALALADPWWYVTTLELTLYKYSH